MSKFVKRALGMAMALIPLLPLGAGAVDFDVPAFSIHGFASAGYIATTGNNYYGKTRDGGALDYYEAGVNAFTQLSPHISLAGQLLSRKAGATDNGSLRLDYGFIDLHTATDSRLGVRIGRVKNPMGFYNESRDVLSTRPSILLPQSIYHEGVGVRELLFSSDGVQLYGDHDWGEDQQTSLRLNLVQAKRAHRQTERNFTALAPGLESVQMDVGRVLFVQVVHQIDEGRQRYALGYVHMPIGYRMVYQGLPYDLSTDSGLFLASAQYNHEDWSLTAEGRRTKTRTDFRTPVAMQTRGHADGGYVQLDYRFNARWSGFVRRDVSSRSTEAGSGVAGVGRDKVLGIAWQVNQAWRINVEYHETKGAGMAPPADNRQGARDKTRLLAVMAGFRF